MRSSAAVVVIPLFLLVVAGAGAQGGDADAPAPAPAATGGWVPIGGDVRGNGFYRQVAKFALVVRMLAFRAEEELTLVEVVAGSVQAAGAGNNYRLLLRAADGGGVGTYEAVVWGVPGSTAWTWRVLSFRRVAGDQN
uniref:Cysteine proteinase inhibitor n=1 Tax=Oryza punctata TaxID=4537 RepID=A0A0E0JYG3_ORYPU